MLWPSISTRMSLQAWEEKLTYTCPTFFLGTISCNHSLLREQPSKWSVFTTDDSCLMGFISFPVRGEREVSAKWQGWEEKLWWATNGIKKPQTWQTNSFLTWC
jgi:hypothetical protein